MVFRLLTSVSFTCCRVRDCEGGVRRDGEKEGNSDGSEEETSGVRMEQHSEESWEEAVERRAR